METAYFVYILSSRSRNLYVGVTNGLLRRVFEHRSGTNQGFTSKYRIHRLVYLERFDDVRKAIAREKQLKSWRREKKLALINDRNPAWLDLAEDWFPKKEMQIPRLAALARDDS